MIGIVAPCYTLVKKRKNPRSGGLWGEEWPADDADLALILAVKTDYSRESACHRRHQRAISLEAAGDNEHPGGGLDLNRRTGADVGHVLALVGVALQAAVAQVVDAEGADLGPVGVDS